MPLGGENKLALLGNPMAGTPNYVPGRDMQPQLQMMDGPYEEMSMPQTVLPTDPGSYDMPMDAGAGSGEGRMQQAGMDPGGMGGAPWQMVSDDVLDQIETAIRDVVYENCQNAIGRDFWRKRDWMMYRAMKDGTPPGDDPTHPLVQLGYHPPLIAKYEQQMRTTILNMLVPDPSAYDNFELEADPLWQGIDGISDALTQLLRRKFKNMTPHASNGYLSILNLGLADYDDLGTCLFLPTYDVISDPFEPGNTDGLIDGPTIQWVDVFNAFPDRDDVNTAAETFMHIWDPVTPENIDRMGLVNLDKLPEPSPQYNRFMDYGYFAEQQASSWDAGRYYQLPAMDQYPRWMGLGRFPYHQVKKRMGNILGDDFMKLPAKQGFQQLMAIIAPRMQFDPATARIDSWFDIQRIENVLVRCQPYTLALPRGKGPLIHDRLYESPGYFWGDGLYKRCQLDERFYADLERQSITIAKFAAQGVWIQHDDQLDDEYRENRGDQFKVEPGMVLKAKTMNQPGMPPVIERVAMNEVMLEPISAKQEQIVNRMQDLTSINNDVQGQSTAKTATQSSQNLQQSMSILQGVAKNLENGLMKETVARCYVIMQQAAQISGFVPPITLSAEEGALRSIQMTADDIMSLTFIDIRMMGLTSPGNRTNQTQDFMALVNLFLPTGAIDVNAALKMAIKLLGVSGGESLIFRPDPVALQACMQDLTAGLKIPFNQALAWLPQSYQQGIGMMLNPQAGPTGGPPPPPPGTPPQAGGGSKPPTGSPKAPGPPSMMQSSGPTQQGPPMMAGGGA